MTNFTRRDFLNIGITATAVSAALLKSGTLSIASSPKDGMQYRILGRRTGLKVSEIGFGGYPINDPDILNYAIDRGINYIDTAPDYRNGKSETVIGKVIKKRRKDVVLTSKWHPWVDTTKKEMLESLNGTLKRLQTDYLDIILTHQVGKSSGGQGKERLDNQDIYEAFEKAKKAGKVKHLGVSAHDGDLMDVMVHALKIDLFDVILCKYSFLDYPKQNEIFQAAQDKGIGVIAMKTLAGARGENLKKFQQRGTTYRQSALKWVLSNPNVSNLVISINSIREVDEYVLASGKKLTSLDNKILDDYELVYGSEVCRFCNECESVCPEKNPVANVLRYSMYYNEYHEEARAIESFNKIKQSTSTCETCPAPCEQSCPYNVKVKKMMVRAHDTFTPYIKKTI